jgi:hypothetical protein
MPYPTFDIDKYYQEWKKVESIVTRSEADNE